LTPTAIFLGVLVGLLVGNEWMRDRLYSLSLLIGLYTLVTFSFLTFFLPVLTGKMNTVMFVLGAALSALVTLRVVELVYQGVPDRSKKDVALAGLPAIGLIGILVCLYFLNWIPPVPLSLKFAGVYHQVQKKGGVYYLSYEQGAWPRFLKPSADPFRGEGPVYCFTAVFAPVDLKTTVYHRWQYRPDAARASGDFMQTDRIAIAISGGREEGYRGYTVKQRAMPGQWRVDVETEDGRVIGRVNFGVKKSEDSSPKIVTITY
jgi:hypothetical protein